MKKCDVDGYLKSQADRIGELIILKNRKVRRIEIQIRNRVNTKKLGSSINFEVH